MSSQFESEYDYQDLPFEQPWKTWDRDADKEGEVSTVFWTKGERYKGEWHRNQKHGRGTQYYPNGDKYEGGWVEGRRSGQGTFWKYDNGKYRVQYNGQWQDDKREGFGTFFNKKGEFFQGEWRQGKRYGKGRQTYGGRPPDGFGGDIYEGDWLDGLVRFIGAPACCAAEPLRWCHRYAHRPLAFYHKAIPKCQNTNPALALAK